MDDVGASSKIYAIYSNKLLGLGNFLFLKYMSSFKGWGPYDELNYGEWNEILECLEKFNAKLTIGVTASWVMASGEIIPIYDKYPDSVRIIKEGVNKGLLEVANHGLTHCVTQDKLFLPNLFTSNRKYHREFWEWIPRDLHYEHLEKSQKILHDAFGILPNVFIPPGNVFCNDTLDAAIHNNIKLVNCNTPSRIYKNLKIISNADVLAFHDRELKIQGLGFLSSNLINKTHTHQFKLISDLIK